jgi:hypothetical protein
LLARALLCLGRSILRETEDHRPAWLAVFAALLWYVVRR